MMCQRIGLSPISTSGLGLATVSSASREPMPPARMTAFIQSPCKTSDWSCISVRLERINIARVNWPEAREDAAQSSADILPQPQTQVVTGADFPEKFGHGVGLLYRHSTHAE